MKAVAVLVLALCALPTAAVTLRAHSTPVSRTVELMKGLAAKIEMDGKAEENLYETFVCWAKSMVSSKTASNEAAKNIISERETYISDLDAGRIELTDERVTLNKQIKDLTDTLEALEATRTKEKGEFEDAEAEMKAAKKALTDAVEVLKTATEGSTGVAMVELEGKLSEGYSQRAAQATSLRRAADLADRVLSKGDAYFLRKLLTGDVEVPTADWKKLNRKATFKMSYKKRSGKIQELLAQLLAEFKANLKEARDTEAAAIATYTELHAAKSSELETAQTAAEDMELENGARGMSREKAQAEVDALTIQVANDEKYIAQVTQELTDKKDEWKDRQTLRAGELAAMSKAIEILHNDDARDLMKKSFASHDMSFLQVGMSSKEHKKAKAVATLLTAAHQASDARLTALATRLSGGSHFDEVIVAIDAMITTLNAEEAKDLTIKETCETDRAADTKDAQVYSRDYDEAHDEMVRLIGEIADLDTDIAEKKKSVEEIVLQLAEAKKMRDAENAEYLVNKADDQEASATVLRAQKVLEDFYKDNELNFLQAKKQPFAAEAGAAPPPPPPTWEAPYGGATGESTGVIAILTMINEDILKDIAKADQEELGSLTLYTKTKLALETEKIELESQITDAETTIAANTIKKGEEETNKVTAKDMLKATMEKIADVDGYCSFFTINYPLRLKNRQMETDGLRKAKTILSGGAFAAPPGEIKPGDALLQKQATGLRLRIA